MSFEQPLSEATGCRFQEKFLIKLHHHITGGVGTPVTSWGNEIPELRLLDNYTHCRHLLKVGYICITEVTRINFKCHIFLNNFMKNQCTSTGVLVNNISSHCKPATH